MGIIYHLPVYAAGPRFAGGRTLLHLASRRVCDKNTPLHISAFMSILEALGPDDIDVFDDELRTPLSIAVWDNNPVVVRKLLEAQQPGCAEARPNASSSQRLC